MGPKEASNEASLKGYEALLKEYYEIFRAVNDFDKNLLTVKGWGVTLSLAALGLGFQHSHYGFFLVATLSGLVFWLIEGTMKRHQMRYYYRMRVIEVFCYDQNKSRGDEASSSPLIDYSWEHAKSVYKGDVEEFLPKAQPTPLWSYRLAWFFPHVFLPHIVTVIAGLAFFYFGRAQRLGVMGW